MVLERLLLDDDIEAMDDVDVVRLFAGRVCVVLLPLLDIFTPDVDVDVVVGWNRVLLPLVDDVLL